MFRLLMLLSHVSKTGRLSRSAEDSDSTFLTFCIEFSAFSEDIFDACHICEELPFDLAGPDIGSCYWG